MSENKMNNTYDDLFSLCGDLLVALKACTDELYSLHSKYGDEEYARENSVGLTLAKKARKEATKIFGSKM